MSKALADWLLPSVSSTVRAKSSCLRRFLRHNDCLSVDTKIHSGRPRAQLRRIIRRRYHRKKTHLITDHNAATKRTPTIQTYSPVCGDPTFNTCVYMLLGLLPGSRTFSADTGTLIVSADSACLPGSTQTRRSCGWSFV